MIFEYFEVSKAKLTKPEAQNMLWNVIADLFILQT